MYRIILIFIVVQVMFPMLLNARFIILVEVLRVKVIVMVLLLEEFHQSFLLFTFFFTQLFVI